MVHLNKLTCHIFRKSSEYPTLSVPSLSVTTRPGLETVVVYGEVTEHNDAETRNKSEGANTFGVLAYLKVLSILLSGVKKSVLEKRRLEEMGLGWRPIEEEVESDAELEWALDYFENFTAVRELAAWGVDR